MPALGTILVDGDGEGLRNWAGNQDFGRIDEGIAGADGSEIAAALTTENRGTTLVTSFDLADMPGDFATMIDLSWTVRYRADNAVGDDTLSFSIEIVSGATNLAGAFSGVPTVVRVDLNTAWNTSLQTDGPTAFAFVNTTATQAEWDAAELELFSNHSQNMGPNDNWAIVDTIEFTGNYTAGAPAADLRQNRERIIVQAVNRGAVI